MTRRRPSRRPLRSPHHRVADFSSLHDLIEHAKTIDGASHLLIAGRQAKIYFPRRDGRYDEGTVWQEHGYWHAPAPSDRVVVTGLPVGAEPIGSHTQRVGRRANEAHRRRREPTGPGIGGSLQLANELSQQLNGSTPKDIPGGFRWSELNEAAQFTTHSPEYSQKVVVVVSLFDDASVAVDFFGDEGLSETARYENIGHFTYPTTSDLAEMVKDIQWVWETVDGYAASWQEGEDGEVDEARGQANELEAAIRTSGGRVRYGDRRKRNSPEARIGPRWTAYVSVFGHDVTGEGETKPEALARAIADLPPPLSKHFKTESRVDPYTWAEARHIGLEPMSATAFIELLSSKQPTDRQTRIRFNPSLAGERGGGSVYVNFINLPPGVGDAGGGAEAENNRASFHIRGFAYDPTVPVLKVKVEQSNNVFRRTVPFRARTGSPEVVARHLSEYLAAIVKTVPPNFTHTTQERGRSRR